jgi:hypothetical protein
MSAQTLASGADWRTAAAALDERGDVNQPAERCAVSVAAGTVRPLLPPTRHRRERMCCLVSKGDTVMSTQHDSNDSKMTMQITQAWQSRTADARPKKRAAAGGTCASSSEWP